jgi:hypothetical protein
MMPIRIARRCRRALPALSLLVVLAPVDARIITVGAARDCLHATLQPAIDAARILPGVDEIRIANDQAYTALALRIDEQPLAVTGGFASCRAAARPDALSTSSTVLSGAGGARAPVITITGKSNVALHALQIRHGDNLQSDRSGCGGGIRYDGTRILGELRNVGLLLRNVGVSQNQADSGGGICFNGRDHSSLFLQEDVAVSSNTAASGPGGGIVVSGAASFYAIEDRTLIAFNRAPRGNGGGIYVRVPAMANIGSPGWGTLGVLYANEARRGGGLATEAVDGTEALAGCVFLYTTDPARPVRVHGNRASDVGGAFYLRSYYDFSTLSGAQVSARDFLIDGNTAPNGPVAYLTGGTSLGNSLGSLLSLNESILDGSCLDAERGRVACTDATQCNRIEDNVAQDFDGRPSNGNVIELRDDSPLWASNVSMRRNAGTRLLSWSNSDEGAVTIDRCALVDNVLTQELFRGYGDGRMDFRNCTIAGNTIGSTHVLRHDGGGYEDSLVNLLIDQPGKLTLDHPDVADVDFTNHWVVATDISTLRPDPTLLQGRGRFVDPERGDYHLRVGSVAVDHVPAAPPPSARDDLDGRPREADLGAVSAGERPRDAGGYERQPLDPYVTNGDFVADLRLWSNPSASHATWDAAFNAPQSVGGSLLFSVPAAQVAANERRTALTYCFNVPSAGTYRILGQALVSPASSNRDYPIVHWRVRYASDDCSGSENASGQGFIARSGSAWQTFTAPLLVPVDAAQWTRDSTIELRLDVAQDPASVTATGLFARFDEIEIVKLPP